MKLLKILLPFLLLALLIWIDLPENTPIRYKIGNRNFVTMIHPLTIDTTIFGTTIHKAFVTKLGLDLQGGSHLVFDVDSSKVKKEDLQDALNSARDVVEKRVNLFGVSEPVVQLLKSNTHYRIAVDLPGITNVNEAVGLIGQTAQLRFKEASSDAKIATNTPAIFGLTQDTGLTGKDVKKATVVFSPDNGQPQVSLEFSQNGAKLFGEITQRNIGKQVGIFLDYLPISAPVVQQAITDGRAVISGSFTVDQAKELAISINSGALPLPIQLVEQRNIGPSLGALEVQRSIVAGVVGLLMVMIFMILYYGKLGFIACGALMIYGLISLAIFRTFSLVLTLPGITGFILSIGMAVDSNILIFERIKEELRKGRDLPIAVRLGFGSAMSAIRDANFTTLIVAAILFNPLNAEWLPQFGLIRGFALTLAIGVATSLFTGVVITKRLIDLFYAQPRGFSKLPQGPK